MSDDKHLYDLREAAAYWSRRLEEADPLAAVLTFDAPPLLNRVYDQWEQSALRRAIAGETGPSIPLRGCEALDVGCGNGRIVHALANLGADVTGVDIAPAMLNACRERCRGRPIELLLAAAENLPLAGRRYDLVTCFGLLEHLPDDTRHRSVSEILRVLKTDGRALLVVNNAANPWLRSRDDYPNKLRHGYHAELVGLDWLRHTAGSLRASAIVHAANPGYALLHYHACDAGWFDVLTEKTLVELAARAAALDSLVRPDDPLVSRLAGHFLVELRLSQPG